MDIYYRADEVQGANAIACSLLLLISVSSSTMTRIIFLVFAALVCNVGAPTPGTGTPAPFDADLSELLARDERHADLGDAVRGDLAVSRYTGHRGQALPAVCPEEARRLENLRLRRAWIPEE